MGWVPQNIHRPDALPVAQQETSKRRRERNGFVLRVLKRARDILLQRQQNAAEAFYQFDVQGIAVRRHSVFRPTLFCREITALRLPTTCTDFRDSCRTAGVEETRRRRKENGQLVVEQSHKLALHRTQIADLLALDHCPVFTPAVLRYEFPSCLTFIIMAALCSRCGHYIFALWFFVSFFSSPNLSRRRLDVYHTSTHCVTLVPI